MSLSVEAASSSKNMVDENKVDDEGNPVKGTKETGSDHPEPVVVPEIGDEDDDDDDVEGKIQLGPKCSLKELSEKDKDDESLRRWKEQLLGSVDIDSAQETLDPEVKILSLAIQSPGRPDIFLLIPETGNPRGPWFTLKEGCKYNLKFTFQVSNNIVSGLKYRNTVWKTGIKVDTTREMIGTFSPQAEPYTHEMPEETTPSGIFARGTYSAKTRFIDDDNRCYLGMTYTFDIKKDWQGTPQDAS